jgi:acetyl esterase/lipase
MTEMMLQTNLAYGLETTRANLLDVMRPNSSAALPVVIHFHGGGWHMFGKYLPETEFLAQAGFCVVSANYRYAQDAFFPAQLEDAKAVVRFIRENAVNWNIDPTRIYAWGISAGAHIAALLGSDVSSHLKAVACICPPTDLSNAVDWKLEYSDTAFGFLLGERADTHPELARAASPLHQVSSQSAPTLIVHGAVDTLVPIAQAKVFHAALEQVGVPSRLVVIPDGDHFINETHMPFIQAEILEFFRP